MLGSGCNTLERSIDSLRSLRLPDAELVSFGVEHHRPARAIAFSVFDLLRPEADKPVYLGSWILRCQIQMKAVLGDLGLWDFPKEDRPNSSLVRSAKSNKIVFFGYGSIARNL